MGAVGQDNPGLAVCVFESQGQLVVKWGEATLFGAIVRSQHAPRPGFIDGLVVDTLEAGEKDVFFSCIDDFLREEIQTRTMDLGHCIKQPSDQSPDTIENPFSLFSARHIRAKATASGGVMSFCELDPLEHNPMEVGDSLHMATEIDENHMTQVAYTDSQGWLVGLHGHLSFVLADDNRALVAEVNTRVDYISWGRSWRSGRLRDMQFLVFEIPEEIDRMLADAKLPKGRGGGHL